MGPRNDNPSGFARSVEIGSYRKLADAFTIYSVNRRAGLPPGVTMAEIAAGHADAIKEISGEPVDVLGLSTGGSVALQLAADHPGVISRLVVAGAALRLGPLGRTAQAEFADRALGGRRALPPLASVLAEKRISQAALRGILWLASPSPRRYHPADTVAVLRAEDAFDLTGRLSDITAPTLVIGGAKDRSYSPDLFRATADGVAGGHLVLLAGRGHLGTFTDRRFIPTVRGFLGAGQR